MIDFKKAPLHPTNEELADFIDNRIIGTRKKEIEEHLLFCNDCMDVVAGVVKNKKEEEKRGVLALASLYVNNLFYSKRIRSVVFSGVVASVVLFILFPFSSSQFNIGEIDLSKPIIMTMGSPLKYQNRVVDGDKIVKEIEESLDKKALSNFVEAQKAEVQKSYDEAINLYRQSFRDAIRTFKGREKLQWQIVIYYHISKIKFERKDEDSSSYIKRVQFWIQKYSLGE